MKPTGKMIEQAAHVAHEANKAWCEANGDNSQPTWADAPDWQRASAVDGVKFHINNPEAGDSASHDNWMKEKISAGWAWGPDKDPDNKKHPCITDFENLPPVQQTKDAIFRSIVHAVFK